MWARGGLVALVLVAGVVALVVTTCTGEAPAPPPGGIFEVDVEPITLDACQVPSEATLQEVLGDEPVEPVEGPLACTWPVDGEPVLEVILLPRALASDPFTTGWLDHEGARQLPGYDDAVLVPRPFPIDDVQPEGAGATIAAALDETVGVRIVVVGPDAEASAVAVLDDALDAVAE
jgi:hypothetical protein